MEGRDVSIDYFSDDATKSRDACVTTFGPPVVWLNVIDITIFHRVSTKYKIQLPSIYYYDYTIFS